MPIRLPALIAVTIVCLSCSEAGDEAPTSPPNVILITMDTMRADHMSCYGYERPTSPHMDALADSATFYTRAMATSPWTIPSHASLFTGRDPFQHGAHTLKAVGRTQQINLLWGGFVTLAEALAGEGFATGAFVANDGMLAPRWNLNQGFETYHVERTPAERLNVHVFSWLDSIGSTGKPFFLFVNYMDTHKVYNTKPRPGFLEHPAVQDGGQLVDELYDKVMPGSGPIPRDLVQKVIDQYDTAVANLDEEIGVLLDDLRRRGIYDNTMIVLTSDHGEYFAEHYLVEHSKDVYQEALWVPLIVKNPSQRQGRVDDRLITSSDIPHIVFLQFPQNVAKRNLVHFPNAPGNHPPVVENYYTRARDLFNPVWGKRFDRVRMVVYDWPYKYIHSSDGASELYHLEYDEKEAINLIDKNGERAQAMLDDIRAYVESRPTFEEEIQQPPLSPEERKRLKSLGYVD
ncbi:MAG: sulfatase [Candidatus Latescibacterota bacterium]|jgi:arylsulfatase A-like enzyme